ncbi:putative Uncharacterized transposase-like protein [Monocercomonoides exilis]|uniref:putative Uncharacterized transposase-like protein n=1 Tax=Monocercomonoides exilis TaxID=2049356 RepID=UPI003559CE33|nr:putative Uncharacterized transposase-like protein [Monocercomonoides exilis]|eukprot:MONOS_536.1-p1 / transcript=MONOS_536.1 / gene=MONOS_536 / organism=Monocercomonoides_exilis_PA203 / gene_product=Uncharacterized transposase-like protein HI1328.1 / transcript_product=Uncharacterized transposase-like protein HI1328.1 / location=Mono_scaffold00008:211761-212501(-) / protein_length=246 / sequence_SO=supercontig / SO=protein_coding / is_pseudo=false
MHTSSLLGVHRNTVGFYYSLATAAMAQSAASSFQPIGGENTIVEIDEAILNRSKYHKGRWKKQIWLFGAVQRTQDGKQGSFFVIRVTNRKKDTLLPIIQANILPGTMIHSDEWRAYSSLSGLGYGHKTVCHKYHFKDLESEICTNMIEGFWSQFRKDLPRTGLKEKFIDDNISSFVFQKRKQLTFVETVREICQNKVDEYIEEEKEDHEEDDDEEDVPVLAEQNEEISEDSMEVSDGAEHSEYEPE